MDSAPDANDEAIAGASRQLAREETACRATLKQFTAEPGCYRPVDSGDNAGTT